MTPTPERKCLNCGGDIAVRNPTGKCDHLYYPENVPTPESRLREIGKKVADAKDEGYRQAYFSTLKQRFEEKFTEEKQPISNYSGTFLDWKEHVVPIEVLDFIEAECERARGKRDLDWQETINKTILSANSMEDALKALASLTHTKL